MNMDEEFGRFLHTVESWLGVDDTEHEVARLVLSRQIGAGREIVDIVDLRPELAAQDPDLQVVTGQQFLRFNDGGWFGVGGCYGPQTKLGQILEREYEIRQAGH